MRWLFDKVKLIPNLGLGRGICEHLRLVRRVSENHASCLLAHLPSHGNFFLEKLSSLAFLYRRMGIH